jgi:transposase-like protein
MKKRKQYSVAFKLKVMLEMLKEERSIPEIVSEFEVHPTMLHAWRREFFEKAPAIFEDKRKRTDVEDAEQLAGQLYKQIGQLKVENDFLKEACDSFASPYS